MTNKPDSPLTVEPISTRHQLNQFISMPRSIYADDPNWVTPLWFEQLHRLTDKNPLFAHLRWQAWIVWRGNNIVGRISAQIDDLYEDPEGIDTGFFGFIEAVDDAAVFQVLLQTAENWLRDRGIKRIRGPFNLSINEECGLLIDGFQTPPVIMMGHARDYYAKQIEAAGYSKAKDLLAYEMDPGFKAPPVMARLLKTYGKNIHVRPLRRKRLKEDLAILRDIFNDSWSNNWGFTPFTEAEFADMGESLTMLVDDDFIQIAEIDGRPVAMIVVFPDINRTIKDLNGRLLPFGWLKLLWRLKIRYPDMARCLLMGVRKECQQSRLGSTLSFLIIDKVRHALVRRNITNVEMSWILEDNKGMRGILEVMGAVVYKRYRIFDKAL